MTNDRHGDEYGHDGDDVSRRAEQRRRLLRRSGSDGAFWGGRNTWCFAREETWVVGMVEGSWRKD